MSKTLRRVIEIRNSGQKTIVGFITDQLPKWNSIHHFTPFLNHDTAVFTGMEQMAKQLDGVVYYADIQRPKRGYYICHFRKMTDDPKSCPNFEITDKFMGLLEEMIHRQPHLWLWSHKRWKRTKEQWLERQKQQKEA